MRGIKSAVHMRVSYSVTYLAIACEGYTEIQQTVDAAFGEKALY